MGVHKMAIKRITRKVVSFCFSFILMVSALSFSTKFTTFAMEPGVEINEVNFPDELFRKCLSDYHVDKNTDGYLDTDEIESITDIDATFWGYGNALLYQGPHPETLKGIEFLSSLKFLTCRQMGLKEIDLSQNIELEYLVCDENEFTTLDLSNNVALTTLQCNKNKLQVLKLPQTSTLSSINCADNELTSLDISCYSALSVLYCNDNYIPKINIYRNELIKDVYENGEKFRHRTSRGDCTFHRISDELGYRFFEYDNSTTVETQKPEDETPIIPDPTPTSEPQPDPTPTPIPDPEPIPDPQPDSKPVVTPLFSNYMTLVDNSPKLDQLNNNGVWQKVIPNVEGIIQGSLARMAWAQQLKDKWGDTYCLFTNGSLVYNRKKGEITVKVGENRDNHSYSICFLDKNGRLETYPDIDDNPNTVTVEIDTTGYAFMLIDDTQKAQERVAQEYAIAQAEAIKDGLIKITSIIGDSKGSGADKAKLQTDPVRLRIDALKNGEVQGKEGLREGSKNYCNYINEWIESYEGYYIGGMQCFAMAEILQIEIFGRSYSTIEYYGNSSNLKVGDVIHFWAPGYDQTYGHWVLITGMSDDGTLTVAQGNLDYQGTVNYDRTIELNGITIDQVRHLAP